MSIAVSLQQILDLAARYSPRSTPEMQRRENFSPLPWVRVYSPDYAPSAQAGIYLVYLFSADGSRVYLSLNQGTSEFRSGHMRAISIPVSCSRAAVRHEARWVT